MLLALPARLRAQTPTTWLSQAQYTQRVFGATELVARFAAQLASAPLYPFEQIAIGGPSTVRGYIQNALVRDNGIVASLEARIPLTAVTLPYISTQDNSGTLRLAMFVDGGGGWNKTYPTPIPGAIGSAGIGLQWDVAFLAPLAARASVYNGTSRAY
jgi:hemolysin activation/secretion protein